ncbi:glycosyltransferase [Gaetbulibacter jejuensis]|uniref:Glycosyltransferase n=1 Tax=Gaetbulibacter jejuensis TaxID=584607 RepID=A0ABN1JI89_9FLAO
MNMSSSNDKKSKKILLISYPLFSHNLAMKPYIEVLLNKGFCIDYFNTEDYANFISNENFNFIGYENYSGLGTDTLNKDFSIFKLGLSILESYEKTEAQIENHIIGERPDFIIHPKFGFVAKLLASKYQIPAINMTSGFVFDPDIVFNFHKGIDRKNSVSIGNIFDGKTLSSKYEKILKEYNLFSSNRNDLYINEESLHIVMNTPEFQPDLESLETNYKFLGMSFDRYMEDSKEDLIYVSLGTVFNKDLKLFENLIKTLEKFDSKVIIYANINEADLPEGFKLAKLGKQEEYLQKAKLFITHGGACSIQESLFYKTPMIVIPQTIEHEINGNNVVQNNFGLQILMNELDESILTQYVSKIYDSKDITNALQEYNSRYDLINNKTSFLKFVSNLIEQQSSV